VAAGQQANEQPIDEGALADEDFANFAVKRFEPFSLASRFMRAGLRVCGNDWSI
jgi:hypothetical protein